jgi:hypothetical protein
MGAPPGLASGGQHVPQNFAKTNNGLQMYKFFHLMLSSKNSFFRQNPQQKFFLFSQIKKRIKYYICSRK